MTQEAQCQRGNPTFRLYFLIRSYRRATLLLERLKPDPTNSARLALDARKARPLSERNGRFDHD